MIHTRPRGLFVHRENTKGWAECGSYFGIDAFDDEMSIENKSCAQGREYQARVRRGGPGAEQRHTKPPRICSGGGINSSLMSSEARLTIGSFCILFDHIGGEHHSSRIPDG